MSWFVAKRSDVHYLYNGLRDYYENGRSHGIASYFERALARVWKAAERLLALLCTQPP